MCTANFSDGSGYAILPLWYLGSTAGSINANGILTTYKNLAPISMNLQATYQVRGITCTTNNMLSVGHIVNVIYGKPVIIFPGTGIYLQKTQVQFYLQVTWANGNNYQTNYVRADRWTTTSHSIDGNGVLTIGSVDPGGGPLDQGGIWIEVHAYFSYMGLSYETSQIVRGVYSLPTLDFISIKGPTSITGPSVSGTGATVFSAPKFPTTDQTFPLNPVNQQVFYLAKASGNYVPGSYVYSSQSGSWVLQYAGVSLGSGTQFYLTAQQTVGANTYNPGLYAYEEWYQFHTTN